MVDGKESNDFKLLVSELDELEKLMKKDTNKKLLQVLNNKSDKVILKMELYFFISYQIS